MLAPPPARAAIAALISLVFTGAECRRMPEGAACEVGARTGSGWACGLLRAAADGRPYASFRGLPYAKQPLADLRFQELQPVEPWEYLYDAREEGPVCPQKDVFYGQVMQPRAMSEECILANVHVPLEVLPAPRLTRQLNPPYRVAFEDFGDEPQRQAGTGAPILVFVHGGGFAFGSGDTDLHGPEDLVSKNVIVITFNYRLGPLGFLSLGSERVPGNAGLRDMVTLLRWVRRNARGFGGDPARITLAGHSAGAAAVHLLALSQVARGLFHKAIIMSGTGIHSFYSTSPAYAKFVADMFLARLAINATDTDDIHRQLTDMPLHKIMEANAYLLDVIGLVTFVPVVESYHKGIVPILHEDPEVLMASGRGADTPLLIGFTDNECQTFRSRLQEINVIELLKKNPLLKLSPSLIYKNSVEKNLVLADMVDKRYFNGTPSLESFLELCSETYFQYPVMKTAQAWAGRAPAFLYQFSYGAAHRLLRPRLRYRGAGHGDDVTLLFRVNSRAPTHHPPPPTCPDDHMKNWLVTLFTNFVKCSDPTCNGYADPAWPAVGDQPLYQDIQVPMLYQVKRLTHQQKEMIDFFDELRTN